MGIYFQVHTFIYFSLSFLQGVIGSESGTTDTLNQHYLTACEKYEMVKDEYESLRKRYDDLITSHSAAVNKLELAQVFKNSTFPIILLFMDSMDY